MKKEHTFRLVITALTLIAVSLIFVDHFGLPTAKKNVKTTFAEAVAYAEQPAPTKELKQGKPISISLPSIAADLTVKDGVYNATSKTWSLSNDAAHYALMTPLANNMSGNTFIYGHNRKEVFAKLSTIRVGDRAYIKTDNGYTFVYRFRVAVETNPYDDSLFKYQGPPILTLQTCSGIWYQNRQLFTFDLVEVSKS